MMSWCDIALVQSVLQFLENKLKIYLVLLSPSRACTLPSVDPRCFSLIFPEYPILS